METVCSDNLLPIPNPHGVTTLKTAVDIFIDVRTPDLTAKSYRLTV
jgi:hypothetical protein